MQALFSLPDADSWVKAQVLNVVEEHIVALLMNNPLWLPRRVEKYNCGSYIDLKSSVPVLCAAEVPLASVYMELQRLW